MGPCFVLGDQECLFTTAYVERVLVRHGLVRQPTAARIAGHLDPHLASLSTVLGLLGVDGVRTVDLNGRSDISLDLGSPLPEQYWNTANLVLDFGTTEHIFNFPQALSNIVALLSHYNHGFINMNPILFDEFYTENGFATLQNELLVTPLGNLASNLMERLRVFDAFRRSTIPAASLRVNEGSKWFGRFARYALLPPWAICFYTARKHSSGPVRYPTQGIYRELLRAAQSSATATH
jgi:hypothetical protein